MYALKNYGHLRSQTWWGKPSLRPRKSSLNTSKVKNHYHGLTSSYRAGTESSHEMLWRSKYGDWNLEMWTPWDLSEVSWLESCPDFKGEIIHVCIALGPNKVSSIQLRDILISQCPHLGVPLYLKKIINSFLTLVNNKVSCIDLYHLSHLPID